MPKTAQKDASVATVKKQGAVMAVSGTHGAPRHRGAVLAYHKQQTGGSPMLLREAAPGSCITVAGTVSFQTNYLLAL